MPLQELEGSQLPDHHGGCTQSADTPSAAVGGREQDVEVAHLDLAGWIETSEDCAELRARLRALEDTWWCRYPAAPPRATTSRQWTTASVVALCALWWWYTSRFSVMVAVDGEGLAQL